MDENGQQQSGVDRDGTNNQEVVVETIAAEDVQQQSSVEPTAVPTVDQPAEATVESTVDSPADVNASPAASPTVTPAVTPAVMPTAEVSPAKQPGKKRLVLLIAIIAAIVLVGAILTMIALRKDDTETARTANVSKVSLMGAELTIVDGEVQVSSDNVTWHDAKVGDQLKQGSYVRTQPSSRTVIALDDGSAIRINNGSVVKLDNLAVNNVVVTNVSGEVYTRVVPSSRKFSVKIADEQYVAMGTAYKTVNTAETAGVEVYHSTVKVVHSGVDVTEGKYYYTKAGTAATQQTLSDIPVEKVKQDAFLAWNYEQDKQNSEFKDKLGYLTKIDEPTAQQTAATANKTTTTTTPSATSKITLTGVAGDSGIKLTWSLTGLSAPNGFKVVKSLAANPTYGKDSYIYVSSPSATSYTYSLKDGKTYHFRVCIYTGDGCSTYSNDVAVQAPLKEGSSSEDPTGTLTLTGTGGNTVSWVLNGSSPKGYKLVWSTSSAPVYPGSDYNYYSDPSTKNGTVNASAGTYRVRVCMYTGGGCTNYSNEITVVIP